MKVARLVIALTATCALIAILVLPQIIEAKRRAANSAPQGRSEVITGSSVHNDKSEPLRDMKQLPIMRKPEREANENPRISHSHRDVTDPVVQNAATASVTANMPGTTLNFDGIPFRFRVWPAIALRPIRTEKSELRNTFRSSTKATKFLTRPRAHRSWVPQA
ncbi:MAG: hypothetical protein DMF74_15970 [Acidobacteria bacterium]|nr:MAG: hypothetical protein DMF74_15970 [Acidobacteriota bacterium]